MPEIPKSEETHEELCPDCGTRAAFVVKCRTGANSWVCETCFNVRWQRDHSRQAFWERAALVILPMGGTFTTSDVAALADAMCAHWDLRFGTK